MHVQICWTKVCLTKIKTNKEITTSYSLLPLILCLPLQKYLQKFCLYAWPSIQVLPFSLKHTLMWHLPPPSHQNCSKGLSGLPVATFNDHFLVFISLDPSGALDSWPSSFLVKLSSISLQDSTLQAFLLPLWLSFLNFLCFSFRDLYLLDFGVSRAQS